MAVVVVRVYSVEVKASRWLILNRAMLICYFLLKWIMISCLLISVMWTIFISYYTNEMHRLFLPNSNEHFFFFSHKNVFQISFESVGIFMVQKIMHKPTLCNLQMFTSFFLIKLHLDKVPSFFLQIDKLIEPMELCLRWKKKLRFVANREVIFLNGARLTVTV